MCTPIRGGGCDWAIADPGKFHSPAAFQLESGKVTIKNGAGKSWTTAFADALIEIANENDKVVALTAAMPDGTGLSKFQEAHPDRYFDCGIAESCTVDIAAGLAKSGMRPVAAIYSTFLQRGFDQIWQEVVLQGLPVVFCMDRAGLVGGDGAVHHGFLDITYLRGFPKMIVAAPADELELRAALRFALSQDQPMAIRYPRDKVASEPVGNCTPFELGRSRKVRSGSDVTLLAYGVMTYNALEAADLLAAEGIEATVINARFAKPVDKRMVRDAFAGGRPVVTIEDHSAIGGFGSAVIEAATEMRLSASQSACLGIPDRLIEHGTRKGQLAEAGLDPAAIVLAARQLLQGEADSVPSSDALPPVSGRSVVAS